MGGGAIILINPLFQYSTYINEALKDVIKIKKKLAKNAQGTNGQGPSRKDLVYFGFLWSFLYIVTDHIVFLTDFRDGETIQFDDMCMHIYF